MNRKTFKFVPVSINEPFLFIKKSMQKRLTFFAKPCVNGIGGYGGGGIPYDRGHANYGPGKIIIIRSNRSRES